MADLHLAEFQRAAVDAIFARLTDASGSRRFLLADEVGLGKTIVARGVLERLLATKEKLDVVYLCSNVEIADQNRKKLDEEADRPLRRVSDLARMKPPDRKLRLYSFTPGTSLREGTGLMWERLLLLYLVHRVLRQRINRTRWRAYFKCGAGEGWWDASRFRAIRDEFSRKLDARFQEGVKKSWHEPVDLEGNRIVLADILPAEVDAFDPEEAESRRRRNLVVGLLRLAVQRVALDVLNPDLVILDEVQRFRDVLDQADQPDSIASRLFRGGAAVLILSATPYRMLSLDHEGDGHFEEFLATVRFLYGDDGPGEAKALRAELDGFRERLEEGTFLKQRDEELLQRRGKLEARLRKVICRTERNLYIEAQGHGVEDVRPTGDAFAIPSQPELLEYVRLRRFLLDKVQTSQHITEYWKSCPAPFTFMDADYAPMAAARRKKQPVPQGVIAPIRQLRLLSQRNLRFRELFKAVFGEPGKAWRFLWTKPTYTYYADSFFQGDDPPKLLVFTCWRFVPKAIALLASQEAEDRIQAPRGYWSAEDKAPLRFTDKGSFHVFDVCFPSPALASLVDPAALAHEELTAAEVLDRTRKALRAALAGAGVQVGETSASRAWDVVARLETARRADLKEALQKSALYRSGEGERFREHADELIKLMEDKDTDLRISGERLDHLAAVAAFSPASCLLRALWSVFPETRGTLPSGVVDLCLAALRSYFNKRVVRAVVEEATQDHDDVHGYARSVLRYCEVGHFQAVADEYVHLLKDVLQRPTAEEAAAHLARVLGLGQGTPNVNVTTSASQRIRPDPVARRAHFALAFGEDLRSDQGAPGAEAPQESRKTAVREAFNSPFWPFVLATTSAGQEGLDFHLFCRDIVHWNLPSNPVDLEQREGRINRRDGLALRRSIAADWPLARVAKHAPDGTESLWRRVFAAIAAEPGPQAYKHGLFPHWVYDCERGKNAPLRRHLFFYENSKDTRAYEELKDRLALYRLVFGQPRQQDLLERIRRKLTAENKGTLHQELTRYMVNLSPLREQHAQARAREEARRLVENQSGIERLVADVQVLVRSRKRELAGVEGDLEYLSELARTGKVNKVREDATYALCYLRDPYDSVFDLHADLGLEDDCNLVAQVAKRLRR
ncbi:MAG: DEAD/DEAH box helicase family protein [Myxococcaceae bacterium]